jgi:hypothetical protein
MRAISGEGRVLPVYRVVAFDGEKIEQLAHLLL